MQLLDDAMLLCVLVDQAMFVSEQLHHSGKINAKHVTQQRDNVQLWAWQP